jgi:hypothetical protein
MIPIYIPTFNNPTYTSNFISQLERFNLNKITVVDNASTFPPMVKLLNEISNKYELIRLNKNRGPHLLIRDLNYYEKLPNYFILSDPDIEISRNIPEDFINTLIEVSEEFKIGKVGLALAIPKEEELIEKFIYMDGEKRSLIEWEEQFWENEVGKTSQGDSIFLTTLDTTFALYNKKYFNLEDRYKSLRIGGRYTSKHLGSYAKTIVPQEENEYYLSNTRYSYFAGKLNYETNPVFEITVHEYTKMVEELDSLRVNNKNLALKNIEQDRLIQGIFNSRTWKIIRLIKRIMR